MAAGGETFEYRLPGRAGGQRPGAHHGTTHGTGQAFAAHARLFDRPDPRRLDLRASLRTPGIDGSPEWLVRVQRQRSAVAVHAAVDLSASMHFGLPRTKLQVAADFVEALGTSAFRAGDLLGLIGFDAPDPPYAPARHGRGVGTALAALLRAVDRPALRRDDAAAAWQEPLATLAGRRDLVFLVSDFAAPTATIAAALDVLSHAWVVPIVVSDPAELTPPADDAWLELADMESGARRSLWLGPRVREAWRERVAARARALNALFAAHGLQPFRMQGRFIGEALSRHFLESGA